MRWISWRTQKGIEGVQRCLENVPELSLGIEIQIGGFRRIIAAWSNSEYLFIRAIAWTDDSEQDGEVAGGRKYNDYSNLSFDTDGDKLRTRLIDRTYYLSIPGNPGLVSSIFSNELGAPAGRARSAGRGLIKYVENDDGKKVRADSLLIPLAEIDKKIGETIRFSYWTRSPKPEFTANSIGFESQKQYFPSERCCLGPHLSHPSRPHAQQTPGRALYGGAKAIEGNVKGYNAIRDSTDSFLSDGEMLFKGANDDCGLQLDNGYWLAIGDLAKRLLDSDSGRCGCGLPQGLSGG